MFMDISIDAIKKGEYADKLLIYLAAPFFNEEQIYLVKSVTDFLENLENVIVYSPMRDGGILNQDATDAECDRVYDDNINAISSVNLVVALVDYKDSGTTFEIGFAAALGIPVVGVALKPDSIMNVMLSRSFSVYCKNFDILSEFVLSYRSLYISSTFTMMDIQKMKDQFKQEMEDYKKYIRDKQEEFSKRSSDLDDMHQKHIDAATKKFEKLASYKYDTIYKGKTQ